MSEEVIMDLVQSAVWTVIKAAAPPLVLGLLVGLVVSIFQTVTSIQEQTLTFVPKILAVFLGLTIFGSFMLQTLTEFMLTLYTNLTYYIR